MTIATTSARSIDLSARSTLHSSIFPLPIFPARRIPAVSMRHISFHWKSIIVSIASRVVPGISFTIERIVPDIAFTREDFPTLGRPIMASLSIPSLRDSSSALLSKPSSRARVNITFLSSRSHLDCIGLVGMTSPRPSSRRAYDSSARFALSALFPTTMTDFPDRRSF